MGSLALTAVFAVAAAVGGAASTARAADPRQVQRAIDRGRDYLFRTEKDGNWAAVQKRDAIDVELPNQAYSARNGQWGGMTAFATLALLASDMPADDPHVRSAVDFLRRADLHGDYALGALGVRAQVWNELPPEPATHRAELADGDRLGRPMHAGRGESAGFYGYMTSSRPGSASSATTWPGWARTGGGTRFSASAASAWPAGSGGWAPPTGSPRARTWPSATSGPTGRGTTSGRPRTSTAWPTMLLGLPCRHRRPPPPINVGRPVRP